MKTCPRCDGPATEDALRQFGGVCEKCLLDFAAERDAPSFPDLEIKRTLGEGGMGVVYEAVQKPLGRTVALKVLSPELSADPAFVERFTREAQALASLSHPNIVGIHDFGVHDGVPFLVMEHVQGASLRKALASGKLTPAKALEVIPQICDALAYAHSKGVVHRDIKPENVLITPDGRVKIADFGLAKLAEADQTRITRTNMMMGTPHYMAPEQVENPNSVDHRADIYSLGVVFYEMLTGELPIGRFKAPSEKSTSDARLDPVVLKSLEKEPKDRWQSAGEMKDRVSRLEGLPTPTPRRPSLAWSLWFMAAAAICGILAATAKPAHFTGLYLGKDQEQFLWFTTAILVLFAGVQALRHAFPDRLAPQGTPDGVRLRAELRLPLPGDEGRNRWARWAVYLTGGVVAALIVGKLAAEAGGRAPLMAVMAVGGALFVAGILFSILGIAYAPTHEGRRPGRTLSIGLLATYGALVLLVLAPSLEGRSDASWLQLSLGPTMFTVLLAAGGIGALLLLRRKIAPKPEEPTASSAWRVLGCFAIILFLSISFDRPGISFLKTPLALAAGALVIAANVLAIIVLVRRRARSSAWGIPAVTLLFLAGFYPMSRGRSSPERSSYLSPKYDVAAEQAALRNRAWYSKNPDLDINRDWPRQGDLPEELRGFELVEGGEALKRGGWPREMLPDLVLARTQIHFGSRLVLVGVRFRNEFTRLKWSETLLNQGHFYHNSINPESLDTLICSWDDDVPVAKAGSVILQKLQGKDQPRTR